MATGEEKEKEKEKAYLARGESGDRVAPCWMQAPCVPTRRLLEGASPVFRQGAGGWRRATPSLGAPFTTMPKASKPFIYMSIVLPSEHVDVNIHPTKQEE